MKVKLEDVARESGVSIATVSRVLNNHPVKEATRLLVEETISRMDYRPNLTARGLIKGTSSRIGVIVSNMENPYFSSIMNAMEIRMREEGYLCNFSSSLKSGEDERDIITRYLDSGVDGMIIVDVRRKQENSGFYADLNRSLPVVLINGNPDRDDTNVVMVDQAKGMDTAMDYLLKLGHRRIAMLSGSQESMSFISKQQVFLKRCQEAGIPDKDSPVLVLPDPDHVAAISEGEKLILPLLKSSSRPSAVFAGNEVLGHAVINAARSAGLSVPEDLSLVAHDNTYLSQISYPKMTTINLNPPRLGLEAAEMMLSLLRQHNPVPRKLVLNSELIIRNSCREV